MSSTKWISCNLLRGFQTGSRKKRHQPSTCLTSGASEQWPPSTQLPIASPGRSLSMRRARLGRPQGTRGLSRSHNGPSLGWHLERVKGTPQGNRCHSGAFLVGEPCSFSGFMIRIQRVCVTEKCTRFRHRGAVVLDELNWNLSGSCDRTHAALHRFALYPFHV